MSAANIRRVNALSDAMKRIPMTQAALAEAVGVTQPSVAHWVKGRVRIPAERCIQIELATQGAITRYDLRPDVFGEPVPASPSAEKEVA